MYLTYLQWSALVSNPNTDCNPFENSALNTTMQIISGTIFTMLCLIVISASTKKDGEGNVTTAMNGAFVENEDGDYEKLDNVQARDGKEMSQEELHAFPVTPQTITFQLLMIFATVYFAMLFTNWGNPTLFENQDTNGSFFANNDKSSFWVKLVTQWCSILIYLFSLVAPILLPNRDFA